MSEPTHTPSPTTTSTEARNAPATTLTTDTPPQAVLAQVLHHLEAFASSYPNWNLDTHAARWRVAQHLAGSVNFDQRALIGALVDALRGLVAANNCNYSVEAMRYEGYFAAAQAAINQATTPEIGP